MEPTERQELGGGTLSQVAAKRPKKTGSKETPLLFPLCLAFPVERLLPNGCGQETVPFSGVAGLCPQQSRAARPGSETFWPDIFLVAAPNFLPLAPSLLLNASSLPRHSLPESIGLTICPLRVGSQKTGYERRLLPGNLSLIFPR